MYQQIAKDRGVQKLNCDAVIDYNGNLLCEIPKIGENSEKSVDLTEIEDDHRYLHFDEENAVASVILYGKIGDKKFSEMHQKLKEKASQGKIKYIVRHFYKEAKTAQPLRLSGKPPKIDCDYVFLNH